MFPLRLSSPVLSSSSLVKVSLYRSCLLHWQCACPGGWSVCVCERERGKGERGREGGENEWRKRVEEIIKLIN